MSYIVGEWGTLTPWKYPFVGLLLLIPSLVIPICVIAHKKTLDAMERPEVDKRIRL